MLRTKLGTACLGLLLSLAVVGLGGHIGATNGGTPSQSEVRRRFVVPPGTHPSLLFTKQELPRLRARTKSPGLPGEAWQRVSALSAGDTSVKYEGDWAAHRLIAMALVYQVNGERAAGRKAVEYFKDVLARNEPFEFYKKVDKDFFATEHWPRAFAYAWDWLYGVMSEKERREIVPQLERWCKALYQHTESWWWRDASYNCGAIPVGALGLLCTSIQGEATHAEFRKWFDSAVRRIRDNYYPTAWRANGICYEGPCYAQYHKNPTQFGEALRRTGGEDIIRNSGAINAMHYQVYQWMPQGGCGPVGDNTDYGRRVFSASYLLGIGEMKDRAALWTFERYADRNSLDPVLTFLWYPEGLRAGSPGQEGWPTSYYFEITPRRAGYVYSRSAWDDERAHYFAFVTRYAEANHQHYDMNSFLFHAFGEEFGTHRNVYSYSSPDHGVDREHNIVVVDGGGWPAEDRPSAGDDCSTNGLLAGLGLGHLADYVRGDARDSYRDNSIKGSCPALRADRTCLFVKQGKTPYLLVVDDIQQSTRTHNYDWQWYTLSRAIRGTGGLLDPAVIEGRNADCAVTILEPPQPAFSQQAVEGGSRRQKLEMTLLRVRQSGSRVRFVAVASAWEKGGTRPSIRTGPVVTGNPEALSVVVEGPGFVDLLVWQPEAERDLAAPSVNCGALSAQGYTAMVRRNADGIVTGYVLGEGGRLAFDGQDLVAGDGVVSAIVDEHEARVSGELRTRVGDGPVPASARLRLLSAETRVFVDGVGTPVPSPRGLVSVGSQANR
jgi:hypothetical protein